MRTLKDSLHFVPRTRIPEIDPDMSFRDVYARLSRVHTNRFIVATRDRGKVYVKAPDLATQLIHQAGSNPARVEQLAHLAIGKLLTLPIGAQEMSLVYPKPIDIHVDEADLQNPPNTVFDIRQAGESIGWYLNHEDQTDIGTQKTVFVCANGHRNTDPDHGTCYYCPFPIVSTTQE